MQYLDYETAKAKKHLYYLRKKLCRRGHVPPICYVSTQGCRECLRRTPEYTALHNAIARCHNPKNPQYKDYGARGITVCDAWRSKDGYRLFLIDMGPKPDKHFTLERKDNNGPYDPSNCLWSTRFCQARNYRGNVKLDMPGGRKVCVADAAKTLKIHPSTILERASRYKLTMQQAVDHYISNGARAYRKCYRIDDKEMNLQAVAEHLGITYSALHRRALNMGGSYERAIKFYQNNEYEWPCRVVVQGKRLTIKQASAHFGITNHAFRRTSRMKYNNDHQQTVYHYETRGVRRGKYRNKSRGEANAGEKRDIPCYIK